MTGYLIDTSVLSVLAPGRTEATAPFLDWFAARDRDIYLSTVTAAEIERGIAKLKRTGATSKARVYEEWLGRVLEGFGSNAVPVDTMIARLAGQLIDDAEAVGQHPGLADSMVAATARSLRLSVLTRNLKHFLPLGVEVIDPLQTLPQ